jgi:hypothetical protein
MEDTRRAKWPLYVPSYFLQSNTGLRNRLILLRSIMKNYYEKMKGLHSRNIPVRSHTLLILVLHSVLGGKVNILGGHSVSHSKQKLL